MGDTSQAASTDSSGRSRTGGEAPLVRAVNVMKSFHGTEVLKGIDLDVHRGEVVCLLGPSGSGKTTFLRCINQLESIDGGRIWVDSEMGIGSTFTFVLPLNNHHNGSARREAAAVRRARALLRRVRETIAPDPYAYTRDDASLLAARIEAGDLLERLV